MLKISELLCDDLNRHTASCDLTVDADMPVQNVLDQMDRIGTELVGVSRDDNTPPVVISKKDIFTALLEHLQQAQQQLSELGESLDQSCSSQFDLIHQTVQSIAQTEKNKLELATENISEGLIIFDRLGKVERANLAARKILGLDEKASSAEIAEAVDQLGFKQLVAAGRDNDSGSSGEFRIKVSGDKVINIRWTEMLDEWQHYYGSVVMLHDVTEEITAERTKTEFIASISHELRTPLTSIQNSVSNILAGVTGRIGSKTRQYLLNVKSDCHRFADLINDLLDVAKIEAGSMPINRRIMNIADVASDGIKRFASEAGSKKIELSCQIDGYIWPIYADTKRITQVLWNLVGNAVRFTDTGGKITI